LKAPEITRSRIVGRSRQRETERETESERESLRIGNVRVEWPLVQLARVRRRIARDARVEFSGRQVNSAPTIVAASREGGGPVEITNPGMCLTDDAPKQFMRSLTKSAAEDPAAPRY